MSFLAGFHEAARRRRVLVTIQVYVDESGIGEGPVLAFGSVMATAENWFAFSDAWKAVLNQPPRVRAFKMSKAKGRIMGDKLRALVPVMNAHPFTVLESWADIAAFKEFLVPLVERPLDQAYFWAFNDVIMNAAEHLLALGQTERFEIIFDEQFIFGSHAKNWYPLLRGITQSLFPRLYDILPVEPLFRDDEEVLPLQAADIFAWLFRAKHSRIEHGFHWLPAALPKLKQSRYSRALTRERLEKRVNKMSDPQLQAQVFRMLDQELRHIETPGR